MRKRKESDSSRCRRRQIGLWKRRSEISGATGASLIEIALLSPIFILLLVGGTELARLAYADVEVSNAARAGVAYAAQSLTTAADTSAIEAAATQDAPTVTDLVVATPVIFCSCWNPASGTSTGACTNYACSGSSHAVDYVQVNTSAAVSTLFHYPGIPATVTLHGQAIMRIEQ